MKFDVRSAIQFAAVAEELSFRRAAERLRVPQPWLSTRIRKLEEQLGFALFIRSTRMVELTDAGRAFLPEAAALAAAAAAAEEAARRLRGLQGGRLRIGVPPYHATIQPKSLLIRRFIESRPSASVELEVGWSPHLIERLFDNSLDLAFVADPAPIANTESITIGHSTLVLVIPCEDDLAARETLGLADLRGKEITVLTRGVNPGLWDMLFSPLEAAGAVLRQSPDPGDFVVGHGSRQPIRCSAMLDWNGRPPDSPAGTVKRLLDDYAPRVPLRLLRTKASVNPLQAEFWRLAATIEAPSG
jgi:DNA-binding transcriptional LysR family regulator